MGVRKRRDGAVLGYVAGMEMEICQWPPMIQNSGLVIYRSIYYLREAICREEEEGRDFLFVTLISSSFGPSQCSCQIEEVIVVDEFEAGEGGGRLAIILFKLFDDPFGRHVYISIS